MTMETLGLLGEIATAASVMVLAIFAVLQTMINRLMRKRIEKLEMLVYWQGDKA